MAEANHAHEFSYGEDTWTARAADGLRQLFETDCEVFFCVQWDLSQLARPGHALPILSQHSLS